MSSTIVKKPRVAKRVAAAVAAVPAQAPRTVTRRLAPEAREQLMVQKAIKYFATHGFSASTRELAKEIGVSQPLLYRYFPNKEALADRVFHEVYLSRWDPAWEDILRDRARPLRERLLDFYKAV